MEYDEDAVLIKGYVLYELLLGCKSMRYTYDMGGIWEDGIQRLRVIDEDDRNHPVCWKQVVKLRRRMLAA